MSVNAFLSAWERRDECAVESFMHNDAACFGLDEDGTTKDAVVRILMAQTLDCVERVEPYLSYTVAFVRMNGIHVVLKLRFFDERLRGLYATQVPKTRRLRLDFSYDGTLYAGLQRQTNDKTVQGTLESALSGLFNESIHIHAASRTDAGVHARHQVAHFDVDNPLTCKRIVGLLNRMLPRDIRVLSCIEVPPVFHARYDAIGKTYSYTIEHHDDAFSSHYTHQTPVFDIDAFNKILKQYEGTHDFRNLAKAGASNTIRTVRKVRASRKECKTVIEFEASGFLRYMVRMMVARALDDVINGTDTVASSLKYPNQDVPKPLAPSSGLTLMHIAY